MSKKASNPPPTYRRPPPPPTPPKTQAQLDREFFEQNVRTLNKLSWGGTW